MLVKPPAEPGTFAEFWDGMPGTLAASDLRGLARAIVSARRRKRPVVWMLGAHTIKVLSVKGEAGLSEEFTVTGERGASVQFWYYPESHVFATPRQFRFALFDASAPGT